MVKKSEDVKFKQAAVLFTLGLHLDPKKSELRALIADANSYQGNNGHRSYAKATLDGSYVTLHGVSAYEASLALSRLNYKHVLLSTTGGGFRREEIWETHGIPIGSDPGYSYGDEYPTGKYEEVFFLDKNPAPDADVQYDGKNKTLKLNAEKTNSFDLEYALEKDCSEYSKYKKEAGFLALMGVLADAETNRALEKAFNAVSKTDIADLDPMDAQSFDAFKNNLQTASETIRDCFARAGLQEYMNSSEINAAVEACTGRKLKIPSSPREKAAQEFIKVMKPIQLKIPPKPGAARVGADKTALKKRKKSTTRKRQTGGIA